MLLILSILFSQAYSPALAPDTLWITRPAGCGKCELVLQPRATLQLPGRPEVSPPFFSIARVEGVGFVTTGYGPDSGLMVFGPSGKYSHDIKGALPPFVPLRRPKQVVVREGGTIHVLDGGANTVLTLDPGLAFVALDTLKSVSASLIAPIGGSSLLLAGLSSVPLTAGHPLHILPLVRGNQSFPIGAETTVRPDRPAGSWRVITAALGGGAVVARVNSYTVELADSTGRVRRVLKSAPPWFTPWEEGHDPFVRRPHPAIGGLQVSSDGMLVVFIGVPSANYRPLASAQPTFWGVRREVGSIPLSRLLDVYDTIIEVVDPETGTLVLSQRFAGIIFPSARYPVVARVAKNILGRRRVLVSSLTLRKPTD